MGGGLADLWERAGHDVTRIGREGGDVSHAEVVVIAVPGGAVADALGKVDGLAGKTAIDATNLVGADPPAGFGSNAEFVKSKTDGPTAKSFNINFAVLYGKLKDAGLQAEQPLVEETTRPGRSSSSCNATRAASRSTPARSKTPAPRRVSSDSCSRSIGAASARSSTGWHLPIDSEEAPGQASPRGGACRGQRRDQRS